MTRALVFYMWMAALLSGCQIREEKYLIPAGYVGPVVIAFGVPGGSEPIIGDDGVIEYEVGPDGVLQLKSPAPGSGKYLKKYYFQKPDGDRFEIPSSGNPEVLQVFGAVVGATAKIEGKPETPIQWRAYIVGVPAARSDWVAMRAKATERVLVDITGADVSAQ